MLTWKVPAEQSEQLVAPAAEYLPVPHAAETALRPLIAQNDPAVQGPQVLWPVLAWKVPIAHAVQASAEALEYWPGAQLRHTVEPAAAKVPEAQTPETAAKLASAQ